MYSLGDKKFGDTYFVIHFEWFLPKSLFLGNLTNHSYLSLSVNAFSVRTLAWLGEETNSMLYLRYGFKSIKICW